MAEVIVPYIENHPRTKELKQFLRTREIPLRDVMNHMAEILGLGKGSSDPAFSKQYREVNTGKGLCGLMCSLLKEDLEIKFPGLIVSTVVADVASQDQDSWRTRQSTYRHGWNNIQFRGEPTYFIDSVHGQVNPLLNKLVFDQQANELFYFPKAKILTSKSVITVDTRLSQYSDVSRKNLKPADKEDLKYLAYQARRLLAA